MYDVVYIFRGLLIGLMVSVPLGPMGVLIIQKTLQKGALAGFVAGMGAACADLFYATVAAFGLGFVINVIQTHELILQIIGGIFLIIVGLKIYFDNPLKQIRMKKRVTKKGLLGDFLTLFFLTVSFLLHKSAKTALTATHPTKMKMPKKLSNIALLYTKYSNRYTHCKTYTV